MAFTKGHGTGNDFVVLPDPAGDLDLAIDDVQALCDRRFGIGADGTLRVVRSERIDPGEFETYATAGAPLPEWFMDYRNADGSAAQMCGNGIRVFGRYLVARGWARPGRIEVLTRGGVRVLNVPRSGPVSVDMGSADRTALPVAPQIELAGVTLTAQTVALPNPHAIVLVDTLEGLPAVLPQPGYSAADFPEGVNVEFAVLPEDPSAAIEMRVHERGVGETLSCGTGACAVGVIAADHWALPAGTAVTVRPPGGTLTVSTTARGTVELCGPAELVASGHIEEHWWHSMRSRR